MALRSIALNLKVGQIERNVVLQFIDIKATFTLPLDHPWLHDQRRCLAPSLKSRDDSKKDYGNINVDPMNTTIEQKAFI